MRQSVQTQTLQSLPLAPVASLHEAAKTMQAVREIPFPLWTLYTKGNGRQQTIR
ncbi:hypothetical protein [Paenibacillus sp. Y412MC10]|uniref:hypothetical protein n=1 Tax=Geobacillus sp. (strain Y412MC10) TaxID=481743 RepID=UPI0016434301|nr:hypothetical protein [Paenibacillus sp. Y412MC10]